MELKNVSITKIGNKNKPSAYLPIKRKVFLEQGLSFDKTYDVEIVFKEVEAKPDEYADIEKIEANEYKAMEEVNNP